MTNAVPMKLIVEIIEIAEKISKFLPIIIFSSAALTLVFAVIDLVENNIVIGIVLCVLAGFARYLAIKISQTRRG